jgi:hypothetical protein
MKKLLSICIAFIFCITTLTGVAQLTTLPNGGNKKATVGERIGLTDVTIHYDRPGVKGREGKIWGQLVAYGFNDLGFGTSKAAPWRAGANENTTIEFTTDVKVEGKDLPAGKYGFSIAMGADQCILIFSKNSTSWGSFFYDEKDDALRVTVKPEALDRSVEWLKYEFMDETENTAVVALEWEKLKIPFKVEVDYPKAQLQSFRNELRSNKGFNWTAWQQAAFWCAQHNTNLDEALTWAETSINTPFVGDRNFLTLSTKAEVLKKLNRNAEADSLMMQALPLGKVNDVHGYARQLLTEKRTKDAFNIFKINYDKHPNEFTTNVGMARGYSGMGDYKKALAYAQKALPQAPDPGNKSSVENMIKKLQNGQDINL